MPGVGDRLIVLCGPTAVGKTTAAIALAEHVEEEIICADSRTIYRGMDIGTAKPTPQQRSRVLHHLLDIADPDEVITLAAYHDRAIQAVDEIRWRGRIPVLTGGTGLYIRAVVDGFRIPAVPPDPSLRARMEGAERDRPGTLHERLRQVDPVAAARIHPRNLRRLVRALEVSAHTGRPMTSQQHRDPIGAVIQIGLTVDRTELYRRIESRVDAQLAAGLVDEVQGLLASGYPLTLPAMQGLGYKEIADYLQGQIPLTEAVRRLKRNTRRYAKRQFTWFRRDQRIQWLDVQHQTAEQVAESIIRMVESH